MSKKYENEFEKNNFNKNKNKKIKISQKRISPLDIKLKKYLNDFEYFLYYAPNVAFRNIKINENKWENIYIEILEMDDDLHNNHKEYCKKRKIDYYSMYKLDGNSVSLECQRLVMHKLTNENNLTSFLRHIRNSLAHGGCYANFVNNKIYMLFVDLNEKDTITARIVLDLESMKKIRKYIDKNIF